MKTVLHILVIGALACTLSACGYKGKLKSPSQIEEHEAKKARKKEKQERKAADSKASVEESTKEQSSDTPESLPEEK